MCYLPQVLSLTPWPFKPLPGLFCLNIFIGCAQKKGWYNKPRIFSLPVSPYFQSLQLPPTWDGRRWVKRFGPGDPHTPAALLSALQVFPLTPNFQTSYYFLPTRWYRWLLGLFLRFRLSPAVFLCLIGSRSRYLKHALRVWLVKPLDSTSTGKYLTSQPASWHSCMRSGCKKLSF